MNSGSLSRQLHQPWLGQAKAMSFIRIYYEWQEPKSLGHPLPCFPATYNRELDWKWGSLHSTNTMTWDAGFADNYLTHSDTIPIP